KIFDGGIVVQSHAVSQRFIEQASFVVGIANVGVVPAEVIGLRVIGYLHKAADMFSPCAREEQGNVLRKFEVAILGCGLRRFGRGEGSIKDHRKREGLQQVQGGIVVFLVV